ncbi:MAG: hypothetical protein CMQ14_08040, partial [Gammaproteobacteria bacterium]|nr:hypothetical protein [Gammaproteobacteria bacterium]
LGNLAVPADDDCVTASDRKYCGAVELFQICLPLNPFQILLAGLCSCQSPVLASYPLINLRQGDLTIY